MAKNKKKTPSRQRWIQIHTWKIFALLTYEYVHWLILMFHIYYRPIALEHFLTQPVMKLKLKTALPNLKMRPVMKNARMYNFHLYTKAKKKNTPFSPSLPSVALYRGHSVNIPFSPSTFCRGLGYDV